MIGVATAVVVIVAAVVINMAMVMAVVMIERVVEVSVKPSGSDSSSSVALNSSCARCSSGAFVSETGSQTAIAAIDNCRRIPHERVGPAVGVRAVDRRALASNQRSWLLALQLIVGVSVTLSFISIAIVVAVAETVLAIGVWAIIALRITLRVGLRAVLGTIVARSISIVITVVDASAIVVMPAVVIG